MENRKSAFVPYIVRSLKYRKSFCNLSERRKVLLFHLKHIVGFLSVECIKN